MSSRRPTRFNVCDFGEKSKFLEYNDSCEMSKVHYKLSYSPSLLSLIVHNADSTFTIDQKDICPASLTLPACVFSLIINLELPNSWPAVRVGGTIFDYKSLL